MFTNIFASVVAGIIVVLFEKWLSSHHNEDR